MRGFPKRLETRFIQGQRFDHVGITQLDGLVQPVPGSSPIAQLTGITGKVVGDSPVGRKDSRRGEQMHPGLPQAAKLLQSERMVDPSDGFFGQCCDQGLRDRTGCVPLAGASVDLPFHEQNVRVTVHRLDMEEME